MFLRQFFTGLLIAGAALAAADYSPTSIRWYGWRVSTSEDLIGDARVTHYSIANMFDGDPRTAWVFKRNPPHQADVSPSFATKFWGGKHAISIEFPSEDPRPGAPDWGYSKREFDGIEIMNGYNKSPETFRRNNRIVEVAIYDDTSAYGQKPIRRVSLSDRMGWHKISLPRKKYRGLTICLTGIRKGTDNDIAISEIRLTKGGRALPTGFPKAYLATTGSECGCGTTYQAVGPDRMILAHDDAGEGGTFCFDRSGRYTAALHIISGFKQGIALPVQRYSAWVVDMHTGRLVKNLPFSFRDKTKSGMGPSVEWDRDKLLLNGPLGSKPRVVFSSAR